jgi:hypothetical protein
MIEIICVLLVLLIAACIAMVAMSCKYECESLRADNLQAENENLRSTVTRLTQGMSCETCKHYDEYSEFSAFEPGSVCYKCMSADYREKWQKGD